MPFSRLVNLNTFATLALVVLVVAGLYSWHHQKQSVAVISKSTATQTQTAPTPSPTPTPIDTTNWSTITNNQYHYSLNLPSNWSVRDVAWPGKSTGQLIVNQDNQVQYGLFTKIPTTPCPTKDVYSSGTIKIGSQTVPYQETCYGIQIQLKTTNHQPIWLWVFWDHHSTTPAEALTTVSTSTGLTAKN